MNRHSLRFTSMLAICLLAQATASAQGLVIADTTNSPHAVLQPVGIDEVRWTEGFWAQRSQVCREQSLPAMWDIMRGTEYKPFLRHFLIAAGQAEGDYHGAAWNDGDFYKFLEAASTSLVSYPNPELQDALHQSVRAITAAQRHDGYLHTPVLIRQRNGDPSAVPFADRHDFEVYNMGHLMTAGCFRFRATGERDLLEAAERAAQFLEAAFSQPTPELARNAVCPSHYMGAVELYRTTGKEKYLRLAENFLEMRNLVTDGGDDNQDRLPFLKQREAVGHAVRANYLFAGAADIYLESGGDEIWETLEAVWDNIVGKKLYITGACGALYDGASPDGSPEQGGITRIHQAYGRNYQLPNTTAHNETCAAIGAVMWNWRMFLASGDAKYIDWMELSLYNAVLSGVSLQGTEYFYVNPLRNPKPLPTELRWSRTRKPFIVSYCCPPNVVRTIAELSGYAYSKSADAIWVNLYGGGKLATSLKGQPLRISQETDYPWDGRVQLKIEECTNSKFELHLRIPGWAAEAELLVNGKTVEAARPGSYAVIERRWEPGDEVLLNLPMPVVKLESHPLVEETRNQIALKRGPVVYCLESTDLPADADIHAIALSADSSFEVAFQPQVLGGVATLEGSVVKRSAESWNSLYRPLASGDKQQVRATFVPYFAWGNRGESEMTVWLPRD